MDHPNHPFRLHDVMFATLERAPQKGIILVCTRYDSQDFLQVCRCGGSKLLPSTMAKGSVQSNFAILNLYVTLAQSLKLHQLLIESIIENIHGKD